MTFQILLSCMHQKDMDIFEKSNIRCDALAVNQCDKDAVCNSDDNTKRMIFTTQRGLSRSRNMAIDKAWSDICLISDDDETFEPDVAEKVLKAYETYGDADVIAFQVANASGFGENINGDKKTYPDKAFRCGLLKTLRISSWQISFRRKSILEKGIRFDEKMGSGTSNGAQEESKFLADCHRAGLNIWYVPVLIATMKEEHASQWFKGFDYKFFYDRGWATRRFLGWTLATLYAVYFAVKKHKMYSHDISFMKSLYAMIKGINSPQER